MTPKLKKVIIIILLLIVLFIVYAIFIKPDPTEKALIEGKASSTNTISQENAQVLAGQISQALLRIEQISLDRSIFTNEVYLTLKDRSQPIESEPIGRPNPFAPIGNISSIKSTVRSMSTSTTSTSTNPSQTGTSTIPAGN